MSLNINQRPAKITDLKYMLDAMNSLAIQDMPHTSPTMRLGPATGGFGTSHPGTSGTGLTGIKFATSEPVPAKTGGAATQKKRDMKPIIAFGAVLAVALAIGAYFLFGGKKPEPMQPAQTPPATLQQPVAATPPVVPLQPQAPTATLPTTATLTAPPQPPAVQVTSPSVAEPHASPQGQSAEELLRLRRPSIPQVHDVEPSPPPALPQQRPKPASPSLPPPPQQAKRGAQDSAERCGEIVLKASQALPIDSADRVFYKNHCK
jgi:hypothetical protein